MKAMEKFLGMHIRRVGEKKQMSGRWKWFSLRKLDSLEALGWYPTKEKIQELVSAICVMACKIFKKLKLNEVLGGSSPGALKVLIEDAIRRVSPLLIAALESRVFQFNARVEAVIFYFQYLISSLFFARLLQYSHQSRIKVTRNFYLWHETKMSKESKVPSLASKEGTKHETTTHFSRAAFGWGYIKDARNFVNYMRFKCQRKAA